MLQDVPGATKDVFREMDGFVGLMSALSTTQPGGGERSEQELSEVIECSRLAFMIASEAITDHADNAEYFQVRRKCRRWLDMGNRMFRNASGTPRSLPP
jgi:hypothetical protein